MVRCPHTFGHIVYESASCRGFRRIQLYVRHNTNNISVNNMFTMGHKEVRDLLIPVKRNCHAIASKDIQYSCAPLYIYIYFRSLTYTFVMCFTKLQFHIFLFIFLIVSFPKLVICSPILSNSYQLVKLKANTCFLTDTSKGSISQKKVLAALFHIHELTEAHDKIVSL